MNYLMFISDDFKCSGPSQATHCLKDPKTLSCGHSVCSLCASFNTFECNKCNQINTINLANAPVVKFIEDILKRNLAIISKEVYQKANENIMEIKNELEKLDNNVDVQFEIMIDDIDLQIESVKTDLDNLRDNLMERITTAKNRLKNVIHDLKKVQFDDKIKKFEADIMEERIDEDRFCELNIKNARLNRALKHIMELDIKGKSLDVKLSLKDKSIYNSMKAKFNEEEIYEKITSLEKIINVDYLTGVVESFYDDISQEILSQEKRINEKFFQQLLAPTRFALKAKSNNRYVSLADDVFFRSNQDTVNNLALFSLIRETNETDSSYSIRCEANGQCLAISNRRYQELLTVSENTDNWEKFDISKNSDGTYSFKARSNNQYVCTESNGNGLLVINRSAIGPWESFFIEIN